MILSGSREVASLGGGAPALARGMAQLWWRHPPELVDEAIRIRMQGRAAGRHAEGASQSTQKANIYLGDFRTSQPEQLLMFSLGDSPGGAAEVHPPGLELRHREVLHSGGRRHGEARRRPGRQRAGPQALQRHHRHSGRASREARRQGPAT